MDQTKQVPQSQDDGACLVCFHVHKRDEVCPACVNRAHRDVGITVNGCRIVFLSWED